MSLIKNNVEPKIHSYDLWYLKPAAFSKFSNFKMTVCEFFKFSQAHLVNSTFNVYTINVRLNMEYSPLTIYWACEIEKEAKEKKVIKIKWKQKNWN